MKRYTYFFIIVLVIAGIVLLGYLFRRTPGGDVITFGPEGGGQGGPSPVFPQDIPSDGEPSDAPIEESQPILPAEARFGLVANANVLNYFVDSLGNVTLIQPDGRVARVSPQGKASVLNSTKTPLLRNASFSAEGKMIVAESGERATPTLRVFDIAKASWRTLTSGLRAPAWSPEGLRLAYLLAQNGRASLEVADLESGGAIPRELTPLRAQGFQISWTTPTTLYLSPKGSGITPSSLWKFNTARGTFSLVLQDRFGLVTLWDKSGAHGLVFATDARGKNGRLELVNEYGESERLLTKTTLPSKCAFQGTLLYCAIPREETLFPRAVLPDDYEKRAIMSEDDFYVIDIEKNTLSPVFQDEGVSVDAIRLQVSGNRIYFVNRYDGKLYAVRL